MPDIDTMPGITEVRLANLAEDISEMKRVLRDLAGAVTKLALVEERQANASIALERAFATLERIEARVSALEAYAPANKRMSVWLDRATWAALAALAMMVAKRTGLM